MCSNNSNDVDVNHSVFDQPVSHEIHVGKFSGSYWSPLPESVSSRVIGKSWNSDCPVLLDNLAYIHVTHWNMKGKNQTGELIFHKNLAQEITEIFLELFEERYPIEKMRLIDDYDANDELSMRDNNTSAFCSRAITGRSGVFSMHSYGGSIDLNPKINLYVKGGTVLPKSSVKFLDREQYVPGLIKEGDPCFQAFKKRGYTWGGNWTSLKDYQHFQKDPKYFL